MSPSAISNPLADGDIGAPIKPVIPNRFAFAQGGLR